jgi:hypothetical protein
VRTAIEHARGMQPGHGAVEGHSRGGGAGVNRDAVGRRGAHGVHCRSSRNVRHLQMDQLGVMKERRLAIQKGTQSGLLR